MLNLSTMTNAELIAYQKDLPNSNLAEIRRCTDEMMQRMNASALRLSATMDSLRVGAA